MTQEEALSILKSGANVFLTGEPGAGKTHTINQYAAYLRDHGIEPSITASTGIAATHINGMTIHSWSGIGIKDHLDQGELRRIAEKEYLAKRIRRAKVLVIDEVSMLPPNVLDMVDAVCREVRVSGDPFGGLQVIFVGDFFQLPPITKRRGDDDSFSDEPIGRFAFESKAWSKANLNVCYLEGQYRQDDEVFLELLSAIRQGNFNDAHLSSLESRKVEEGIDLPEMPKLFSHNLNVDRVNNETLSKLDGKERVFNMRANGSEIVAASLKKGCLSPEDLVLKIGATVMFTKNNPSGAFVNGTIGIVTGFNDYSGYPMIKTKNGKVVEAEPMDWEVSENGRTIAKITQVPLRLAWAITVHKSQGMSLDAALMDLSEVFEYGQGYVALSRIRRLSGLHILGWNKRAFQVHPEVLTQDTIFRRESSRAEGAINELTKEEIKRKEEDFISYLGGNASGKVSREGKSEKESTYDKTLALWNKGESLAGIATSRKLGEQTILDHIEKLVLIGHIDRADLPRLITPTLSQALPEILKAFKKLETNKLSVIFEHFGGRHSYDDLRIARLFLDN